MLTARKRYSRCSGAFVVKASPKALLDTVKKVAARREAGKARKRTGREGLTGSGNDCIFCNNRNNRYDECNKKDARYRRGK